MSYTVKHNDERWHRDQDGWWHGTVTKQSYQVDSLPSEGAAYGGTGDPWEDATVREIDVRPAEGRKWWEITITYSDKPTGSASGDPEKSQPDNTPIYELTDDGVTFPLNRHPDYKLIWDHNLWARGEEWPDGTVYFEKSAWGSWDTDTKMESKPDSYKATHEWIAVGDSREIIEETKDGIKTWDIQHDATKAAIDEWIQPGPQVREVCWFSNYDGSEAGEEESNAVDWIKDYQRGNRAVPKKCFGFDCGDTKWLIMRESLVPDGERWRAEIVYQHSPDGWDTDVYKWTAATTTT